MAWIATLAPPEELAVRMAICLNNPWCRDDNGWQLRIAELEARLVKSAADRQRFAGRAQQIARDMDAAVREMKTQAAGPAPVPMELTR
ncbi:MAG TPA: hypothetical protein VGL83_02420 [Stellaceae bacterium]